MPRTTPSVSVASRFIGPPLTLQARTPHTIRRARGVARALRERRCTPRPRVPPNLFPHLDCEAPVVLARSDRPTSKCAFQPLSPVRNWYNPHTPSLQVLALSDCLPHPPPGLSPCPVCRIVVPLRHLAKPESVSVYIFEYVPVGILNCARQAQGMTDGSPAPVDPVLATFSQAERISTCTCAAPLPMPSLWLDAPDAHTHSPSLSLALLPSCRPARRDSSFKACKMEHA